MTLILCISSSILSINSVTDSVSSSMPNSCGDWHTGTGVGDGIWRKGFVVVVVDDDDDDDDVGGAALDDCSTW